MNHTHIKPFVTTDSGTNELNCPRCGGIYLRHVGVTMFDRPEDGDKEIEVSVSEGNVTTRIVDSARPNNPSPRRHGLAIAFVCETCAPANEGDVLELTLAQHKGTSIMQWRHSTRR